MSILPLEIPPGIVKTDSPHAAKGRYTDSNKVRFIQGKPQKWGGWQKLFETQFAGIARGIIAWANIAGTYNIALGTHTKLYVVVGGDTLTDITPIRDSGSLGTDPFAVVDTETDVTVTHTNHGVVQGDSVTFGGATAGGGITIDGVYLVTNVTDSNTYIITHSTPATSTDANTGGASVTYSYEINVGNQSTIIGIGWGAGGWGGSFWGTPRTDSTLEIELRHWAVQEFGNDLLAAPHAGTLYDWTQGTDATAQPVANAPTAMRSMFVTAEGYIFALGTTTPMTIEWPDRDDFTDWTPSDTNSANIRAVSYGSKLMAGAALEDTLNLVWSDTGVYVFQFTGSNFVYDSRLAGQNCGLSGPLAFTVVGGTAYWMSAHNFHMYNGSVIQIPNAEDIREWVFENMDLEQSTKIWSNYNSRDHSIIWGYVVAGEIEPMRYVEVSLYDYSWSVGTLSRTVMAPFRPADASLVMAGQDGFMYEHEVGTDDDGAAMEVHITFGLYALVKGEKWTDIIGFIPDTDKQVGDLSIELSTKDRPNSSSDFATQTLTATTTSEIVDARLSGRHFTFTVRSNVIGGDFALGIPALEIQDAGDRR